MDSLGVDPPEIDRHRDRDRRREPVLVCDQHALRAQLEQVIQQADDVLPGRDGAARAGQDVVKQERRDRQPGQPTPHRLLDDAVHPPAHEHGGALDVDAAHRIAKEHHGQDKPRRRLADLRLDDASDVIGCARKIAQHDCRRAPEGDEREHHARHHQHLAGRRASSLRSRRGESPR